MKRFGLTFSLAFVFLSLFFYPSPIVLHAEDVVVSFIIINDEQTIDPITVSSGSLVTLPQVGEQIISRDNVVLSVWFKDASLTVPFYAEDEVIIDTMTLYSEWRYVSDSVRKASLTLSSSGTSFQTGAVTISLLLYAPLAEGVTYQWQSRLIGAPAWIDIEGANEAQYTPQRNGTYEFRVKYFVQQWLGGSWTEVRKESESVTMTLTGAFDWQLVYYPLGVLIIVGLVFWVKRKQPIDYYIDGILVKRRYMNVYEDISVQPTMEKEGFIFSGWYNDAKFTNPFEGIRMPRKKVMLYGEYRKKA